MGMMCSKDDAQDHDGTWVPAADPIRFESDGKIHTSIIMLHGFFHSGEAFAPPFKNLLRDTPGIRLVFPTSPDTEATFNKKFTEEMYTEAVGKIMAKILVAADYTRIALGETTRDATINSWFDDIKWPHDGSAGLQKETPSMIASYESGDLSKAIAYVHGLIREEHSNGIAPERIFVGGHSMGAYLAALATLQFEDFPIGGLFMISPMMMSLIESKIAPVQKHLKVTCCIAAEGDVQSFTYDEVKARLDGAGGTGEKVFRTMASDENHSYNHVTMATEADKNNVGDMFKIFLADPLVQ